jgi:hypothetical protein
MKKNSCFCCFTDDGLANRIHPKPGMKPHHFLTRLPRVFFPAATCDAWN